MATKAAEPVVEYLILVEFHHTKGPQVEYSFPPLPNNELPEPWKNLPFLCLPDGCHNVMEDMIYFNLPSANTNPEDFTTIFGVSCYRQIAASELSNKSSDITRSYVQKSLCVLSKKPLYGLLGAKLFAVSGAFFQQKDFSEISVLQECYEHISTTIRSDVTDEASMFTDVSIRSLVRKFRFRTLQLFKLLMLEKKVLCTGKPVRLLCGNIVSLLSLMPGIFATDLPGAATLNGYTDIDRELPDLAADDDTRSKLLRDLGLPLLPFQQGAVFHPYMALQDLGELLDRECRSFLVGATNMLFTTKLALDVLIDFETGQIEIRNPEVKRALDLTTEDLRFMDQIVSAVDESWVPGQEALTWEGSDSWIRQQFESYLVALMGSYLRFVLDNDQSAADGCEAYGTGFLDMWTLSTNYKLFKSSVREDARFDVVPGHPCKGEFTMRDLKIKLASVRNQEPAEKPKTQAKTQAQPDSPQQPTHSTASSTWASIKTGYTNWSKKREEERLKREAEHAERQKQMQVGQEQRETGSNFRENSKFDMQNGPVLPSGEDDSQDEEYFVASAGVSGDEILTKDVGSQQNGGLSIPPRPTKFVETTPPMVGAPK
eukprot:comp15454_c0_seq1/m.12424 comp15454_c0_seq1/g.12424  ORF comp15454_c0_seq1/g.12424 comp15454_c0_seq1/m.12424 type:complete len:600 (-) comp15454_c0_seq1:225-2024(-)